MAKHKGLSFYEKKKKISKGMVREIFSVICGDSARICHCDFFWAENQCDRCLHGAFLIERADCFY